MASARGQVAFYNPLCYILSISMYMQNFITTFHSVQEIEPFSLFQNLELGKASTADMINVILQSLGLDLVNINVHAQVHQTIPNDLRAFLRTVQGFANCPGTGKCDYRTHSESQPSASLSVDFLRVVQFCQNSKLKIMDYLPRLYEIPVRIIFGHNIFNCKRIFIFCDTLAQSTD